MSRSRVTWCALAAGLLAPCVTASPLAAQRVEKDRPAPGAQSVHRSRGIDSSYFAVVLNADTLATEVVVRTPTTLAGDLRIRQPRPMAIQYTMHLRADGIVDSLVSTNVDGGVASRATVAIRADSAILTMEAPGLAQPQVSRIAAPRGTLPFINLSAGALDVIFRRARAVGGDTVAVPLLLGPQVAPARVHFIGRDSAVLNVGVEVRAAVSRDGAFLGGRVPAQNVRFVRLAAAAQPGRPAARTPASPDHAAPAGAPYTAEEVVIRTPDGMTLAGTLTLPRGASRERPSPVVVTISGSGPQNRDSELAGIAGYAIFRQVADTLGRRGVGVLRLDDRGAGASGPLSPDVTSATFASDIRAALAWLRTRPDVDAARLALLGHSEGGIVAPMVAAEDSTLRAVALLAATSRPGAEVSAYQRRHILGRDPRIPEAARDSVFRVAQAQADSLILAGTAGAWTRFYWTYDPRPALRAVRAPVLILQGETDSQVPAAHAAEIGAVLRESGNDDVTVRVVPRANHLFLDDAEGSVAGYAALPSKAVLPVVLGTIADWFAARLGR